MKVKTYKDKDGGVWYEVLDIKVHRESFIIGMVMAMIWVVAIFFLAGVYVV